MAKLEDSFRQLQALVNDDLPESIFNGGTAADLLETAEQAEAALALVLAEARAAVEARDATDLVEAFVGFAIKRGRKRLPPGLGEEGVLEPDFDFLRTAFAEFNIERLTKGVP